MCSWQPGKEQKNRRPPRTGSSEVAEPHSTFRAFAGGFLTFSFCFCCERNSRFHPALLLAVAWPPPLAWLPDQRSDPTEKEPWEKKAEGGLCNITYPSSFLLDGGNLYTHRNIVQKWERTTGAGQRALGQCRSQCCSTVRTSSISAKPQPGDWVSCPRGLCFFPLIISTVQVCPVSWCELDDKIPYLYHLPHFLFPLESVETSF